MRASIDSQLAGQFLAFVQKSSRVRIGAHMNPDGDTIGSALALSFFLDAMGIQSEVLCPNPAPANLKFLPGIERVAQEPGQREPDLGIVVDLEALSRLGKLRSAFDSLDRLVVIDHHVPSDESGHLRIVNTSYPATAMIVFHLLRACKAQITPEMALCLLTGIVTDTGSFRFRNTTPETLEAAADLLTLGADIVRITEEVYQKRALPSVLLLGRVLRSLHLESGNRIAWASVRLEDYEETGAQDEHTEGLANEMLAIDTVQVAAVLREPRPGAIRVSLRSRDDYDVSAVAREFGGGGHVNAAGCTLALPMEEAERKVVAALKRCLESSS